MSTSPLVAGKIRWFFWGGEESVLEFHQFRWDNIKFRKSVERASGRGGVEVAGLARIRSAMGLGRDALRSSR